MRSDCKISGIDKYIKGHFSWFKKFNVQLPDHLLRQHSDQCFLWAEELSQWSLANSRKIRVLPIPLGDPHSPSGSRAGELILGPGGRRFIWKPGVDRFQIEKAFNKIVELLGSESGLLPVYGFQLASGGAWKKVKFKKKNITHRHCSDKSKRPIFTIRVNEFECTERLGKAFASLLILVAAFNLPDIHSENLIWDGKSIRLLDTEFFAGPVPNSISPIKVLDRKSRIAERVNWSDLLNSIFYSYGGNRMASVIVGYLPKALNLVLSKWSELLEIRASITGRTARILFCGTREYLNRMPYAVLNRYKVLALDQFLKHVPPCFDRLAAFDDLANGCVPKHVEKIPEITHESNGVIVPDKVMIDVIAALLAPGVLAVNRDTSTSIPELLENLRVEDGFGTLTTSGLNASPGWDDPGLCHGLGGVALFHAAEHFLNLSHRIELSDEIWSSIPEKIKKRPPIPGVNIGLAGEFMLGWGLYRLNLLNLEFEKIFHDRLNYFCEHSSVPIDFATGLAGNLVGVIRAFEFLQNRRADCLKIASGITDCILDSFDRIVRAEGDEDGHELGFAHGLAGAAFALNQCERKMGVVNDKFADVYSYLKRKRYGQFALTSMTPAFCYNGDGVDAVIRYIDGVDSGWNNQPVSRKENTNRSGCCGDAAYHIGRVVALTDFQPGIVCDGSSPFGYYGVVGIHYLELSRFGDLVDPVWGRNLLSFGN